MLYRFQSLPFLVEQLSVLLCQLVFQNARSQWQHNLVPFLYGCLLHRSEFLGLSSTVTLEKAIKNFILVKLF